MKIYINLILWPFLCGGVFAAQDDPVPMQFYEVVFAQVRSVPDERHTDWILFRKRNEFECFETPFYNAESMMAAGLCGEALDVEGLNVSEVISLTQEEYCFRTVEIGALPFHRAQSWAACEFTPQSVDEIRVNAGLMPIHIE